MQILYTAHATATGGRDGRATSSDKALDVRLSTPKQLGGAGGDGSNPEQPTPVPAAASARTAPADSGWR